MDASLSSDILIFGAGPAGLMAAYELAKQGKTATILEARDRTGGRIHSVLGANGQRMELGAEFVHGEFPVTRTLMQEAGLARTETGGTWVQIQGGKTVTGEDEESDPQWEQLLRRMDEQQQDTNLQDFLAAEFPGTEHASLVARAVSYAEGYDTADASRASVKALHAEWSREAEAQYRIPGGYSVLLEHLIRAAVNAGSRILTNHPVTAIRIGSDGVTATAGGRQFGAPQAILALPLGVLQSDDAPQISPATPAYTEALQTLGFGDVIKIVLHFRSAFWNEMHPNLGFLLSGAPIPTWWTQAPDSAPVLTGWLGGRTAKVQSGRSQVLLLEDALASLHQLFGYDSAWLQAQLLDAHIAPWSADPYTRGAYAYGTVDAATARAVLAQPLQGKLHFAGEYLVPDGPTMGTVEAALSSGQAAARRILLGGL